MVQSRIEPGAPSHPVSGPAAERQYVRQRHGFERTTSFPVHWLLIALLLVGLLVAVARLIPRPGSKIDRYEFEHWIHSFAKVKKDDSLLRIRHTASPLLFRFQRIQGIDNRCCLIFKVPRTRWSESHIERLRDALDRQEYQPRIPGSDAGTLLECTLELTDIWDPASGAMGARLLHVVLDALGLGSAERFDISFHGENSLRLWGPTADRWAQGSGFFTKSWGKKISRNLQEERKKELRNRQQK